jgi:hypothetical protein
MVKAMTTRTRAEPDHHEPAASSDLHLCLPLPRSLLFFLVRHFSKRCFGARTDCGIYDASTLTTVLAWLLGSA